MKKSLFISNTAKFSKFNRTFMRWFKDQGWQFDYCLPNDETISDCNKNYILTISRSPFSFSIY